MVILFFLVSFLVVGKIVIKYYSKHWNDGLSASVYFETDGINEGETGHICEELINDKFLPLPVVNVKFELDKSIKYAESVNTIVSDKQYRSDTLMLGSHKKIIRRFEVKYTKRGIYNINSITLNTIDPVSDYKHIEVFETKSKIYVYPSYSRHKDILAPFSRIMGEALRNRFVFDRHKNPTPIFGVYHIQYSTILRIVNGAEGVLATKNDGKCRGNFRRKQGQRKRKNRGEKRDKK